MQGPRASSSYLYTLNIVGIRSPGDWAFLGGCLAVKRWALGGVLSGVLGEALPAFWPRLGLRFGG